MKIKCCHCGNEDKPTVITVGPHIGLYCAKCNAYIKWANKQERKLLKDDILNSVELIHKSNESVKWETSSVGYDDKEVPW